MSINHGFAGGMAGITVDIVFYPLETIKTRIMASSLNENLKNLAFSKFKGFSCQMIASFPYSFSFFYTYEMMRSIVGTTHLCNFISSVTAEIVANLVRNPFEIIKQQMMVGRSDRILHGFNTVVK
jgi:solute carrier family 25 S-adenosylmethionine transporter 26